MLSFILHRPALFTHLVDWCSPGVAQVAVGFLSEFWKRSRRQVLDLREIILLGWVPLPILRGELPIFRIWRRKLRGIVSCLNADAIVSGYWTLLPI